MRARSFAALQMRTGALGKERAIAVDPLQLLMRGCGRTFALPWRPPLTVKKVVSCEVLQRASPESRHVAGATLKSRWKSGRHCAALEALEASEVKVRQDVRDAAERRGSGRCVWKQSRARGETSAQSGHLEPLALKAAVLS